MTIHKKIEENKVFSHYGATKDEWATLDVLLGLTVDLLPVVANPKATISPDSKMRDKGKVPSRYNRQGDVAGFPNWTQYKASEVDMGRWSRQADYGICLQTRNVRALDVDVPDFDMAVKIEAFITERLGVLPKRTRNNSSKFLLAFIVEGEMPKRVIKVREKQTANDIVQPAWLIEFLGNGQQFIAAGTHTSGARIEWDGGLPDAFPVITAETFDALWHELGAAFAIEPSYIAGVRKRGEHFEAKDATADLLDKHGLILGEGNDGQLFVECPWKDEHSMDSGITECAYFPRGSGGYDLGHFKCMHASHADKSDTDFEEALGLRDDMFEALPLLVDKNGNEVKPWPPFKRNRKEEIIANLYNIELALRQPDICGLQIRYDTFRDDDTVAVPGEAWRSMTDADSINLRKKLERFGFKSIGREMMRDAITAHGDKHRFDSGQEWANNLDRWDGVPRINQFFAECFGTEDSDYATAVSRYLWTALAGRTLVPGIKADMVIILQGKQGVAKSTAIASLVPWEELFTELSIGDPEDKLMRMMRGKLIAEFGELRGLHSRELEDIKAFIVRRHDQWVPKFKERAVVIPRRPIFIGTTNHAEFLIDDTGNRRFLPITVQHADIKKIEAQRIQLWAEGISIFKKTGIAWQDAEALGKNEHEKFKVHDSWEDSILSWLDLEDIDGVKPGSREYVRIGDVLLGALNIDACNVTTASEKRVARVLRGLGYESAQRRIGGKNLKVFARK